MGFRAALVLFFALGANASAAQSLDGVWVSDGYGLLVEVAGPTLSVSQLTAISCMPWWTAKRTATASMWATYDRGDAEIELRTKAPDELTMREGPSLTKFRLTRLEAPPETCRNAPANTPIENYAIFWQTFAEQFILFQAYGVDWEAVDRKYRPTVTAATTPDELFTTLREMILPFENAHTNINASSIGHRYIGYRTASDIGRRLRASTTIPFDSILGMFTNLGRQAADIVGTKYAAGPLRGYANDVLRFGMLRDSIGYLQVLGFEGFSGEGTFGRDSIALQSALDEIFTEPGRMKGLIIDVRVNPGGSDAHCLAIAARLSAVKYQAWSKVARRIKPGPVLFTEAQAAWVEPAGRAGYRGDVVLLMGPETLSGGETFAMALRGRTPRVTFVGENTQGVFSDIWGRRLPNGWSFGLPTEVYFDNNSQTFDRTGVPPDVLVPVFPKGDLESSRDGALERAIALLRN